MIIYGMAAGVACNWLVFGVWANWCGLLLYGRRLQVDSAPASPALWTKKKEGSRKEIGREEKRMIGKKLKEEKRRREKRGHSVQNWSWERERKPENASMIEVLERTPAPLCGLDCWQAIVYLLLLKVESTDADA